MRARSTSSAVMGSFATPSRVAMSVCFAVSSEPSLGSRAPKKARVGSLKLKANPNTWLACLVCTSALCRRPVGVSPMIVVRRSTAAKSSDPPAGTW